MVPNDCWLLPPACHDAGLLDVLGASLSGWGILIESLKLLYAGGDDVVANASHELRGDTASSL